MARLHIYVDENDGETEVWIDTDDGEKDGLSVGSGRTVQAALDDARLGLRSVITALAVKE